MMYMSASCVGLEEVRRAYEEEKDPKLRERMRMVMGVLEGLSTNKVAERLMVPQPNVSYWKRRFEREGLEGLRDRPKSGRPPKVERWRMERIRKLVEAKEYTTATEALNLIHERTGVRYSLMHATRILHSWGLSRKRPSRRHVKAASDRTVRRFKKGLQRPSWGLWRGAGR